MFFFLDSKVDWGSERSIYAFFDDILFCARSPEDIKTEYERFDGPARQLGLDMNLGIAELHVMRGMGHTVFHSRHGGVISTRDQQGNAHQVYKYLGVFFYTADHATRVYDFIKTEINVFYACLASLNLTALELVLLINKLLLPTICYRLLAGAVTKKQLHTLQQLMWSNIASYGKLPSILSPQNRYFSKTFCGLYLLRCSLLCAHKYRITACPT